MLRGLSSVLRYRFLFTTFSLIPRMDMYTEEQACPLKLAGWPGRLLRYPYTSRCHLPSLMCIDALLTPSDLMFAGHTTTYTTVIRGGYFHLWGAKSERLVTGSCYMPLVRHMMVTGRREHLIFCLLFCWENLVDGILIPHLFFL
jgi:hypothetical protein